MKAIAHNLVHKICGEHKDKWDTCNRKLTCCIFNRHHNIDINQVLKPCLCALHTILSTENVHKCAGRRRSVFRFAQPETKIFPPVLHNCAVEKYLYKSTLFGLGQTLAHNFIHRTCAELHLLHCAQLATLPNSLLIRFILRFHLQEFTCSLFFKPQAGPSGHC